MNSAVNDLQADKEHDMFAYLSPEDVDSRFAGGECGEPVQAQYKVAVIGTGVHGQGHIKYQQDAGAQIFGIYDIRERSMRAALPLCRNPEQVRLYESAEAACSDPEVDAVIIATPNCTHREIFELAVRNRKHVLLEKPQASTIEDARAILQLAENYDRKVMVGLEYRLKPLYMQAAHEAFVRKSLGQVKMISILEHRPPFLNKAGQWNKFSKYSGGTLVEKCCHYFDQFNFFAQSRPARVFASGGQAVHYRDFKYKGEQSDILDHAYAIVEYENGVRASLDLCMFSKEPHEELVLAGDQGRLQGIDGETAEITVETTCRMPESKQYLRWNHEGGHSGSSPAQAYLFADVLAGRIQSYPTVEDGFWSVVVATAAEESVRSGMPVGIEGFLKSKGISFG